MFFSLDFQTRGLLQGIVQRPQHELHQGPHHDGYLLRNLRLFPTHIQENPSGLRRLLDFFLFSVSPRGEKFFMMCSDLNEDTFNAEILI